MRITDSGDWATLVKSGRIAVRMSQHALAEAIGVSRSTVVRWEKNQQKPENAEIVRRLSEAIRVDFDALMRAAGLALAGSDSPEPDPRLRGLDPNSPTVRRILSLDVSERYRGFLLDRQRELDADRARQDLADVERLAELERQAEQGRLGGEGRVA